MKPIRQEGQHSPKYPSPFTFLVWAVIHKTASGRALLDLLVSSSLFVICCDDCDINGFERLSVSSLYVPREKTSALSFVCINPLHIYIMIIAQ